MFMLLSYLNHLVFCFLGSNSLNLNFSLIYFPYFSLNGILFIIIIIRVSQLHLILQNYYVFKINCFLSILEFYRY